MFGKFFQRKPTANVVHHPIGEVFPWPKNTVLRVLDPLILAIPAAVLEQDEVLSAVIHCDDNAEIAIPEEDDKIYIRMQPGMRVSLTKNVQAVVIACSEGDQTPKRIEVITPPEIDR